MKLRFLFLLCLFISGLARAGIAYDARYRYQFTGTCTTHCVTDGSAVTATLVLNASYEPGTQIELKDFYSFSMRSDSFPMSMNAGAITTKMDFEVGGILPWGSDEADFGISYITGTYRYNGHLYNVYSSMWTSTNGMFGTLKDAECCAYRLKRYNSGIQGTWTLVAAPIPEPDTYAMLLGGMGLIGVAARQRQRRGKSSLGNC